MLFRIIVCIICKLNDNRITKLTIEFLPLALMINVIMGMLTEDFLLPPIIYQDKTNKCLSRISFPMMNWQNDVKSKSLS